MERETKGALKFTFAFVRSQTPTCSGERLNSLLKFRLLEFYAGWRMEI